MQIKCIEIHVLQYDADDVLTVLLTLRPKLETRGRPAPLHHHPTRPWKLIKYSRTTFSRFFFVHNPSSVGKHSSLCISIVHTPSPAEKQRLSSGR